jgi:hypothetical protein
MEKNQLKDEIFNKKEEIAEAKSNFRKFKKAHGIRSAENVKEEKLLAEFNDHEAKIAILQEELDALNSQIPPKSTGSRGSYSYGKVIDPVTKEERDATKQEMKRWRSSSRKKAKAQGISPQEIEWDPAFLIKPEKEVKPKKEKVAKEKSADAPAGESKPKKKKQAPEAEEVD